MTPSKRNDACLLLAIGVLMAGLCGTCTLNVVTAPENGVIAPLAWIIGGTPTLLGIGIAARSLNSLSNAKRGRDD